MSTVAFKVGETYATRSACDWDTIFTETVVSRTQKTIRTESGKTLRVRVWGDVESVKPHGSYSMCPVLSADKTLADVERQS